jgi:hypothetical protein
LPDEDPRPSAGPAEQAPGPDAGPDAGRSIGEPLAAIDTAKRHLREASYRTRYLWNAYPPVFLPIARLRYHGDPTAVVGRRVVRRDTELVLEGFGRAGSTFALFSFRLAQGRDVRVAHHTHSSAQIVTAVRYGVPTVVIVRPPVDSVLSHMARRRIPARAPLEAWTRFHERLVPLRERIVVTSFEEMTTDFGAAIGRVNGRFGTSFATWTASPERDERVFELIEQRNVQRFGSDASLRKDQALARPTPSRIELKRRLLAEVEDPKHAPRLARAEAIYRELVGDPPDS